MLLFVDQIRMVKERKGRAPIPCIDLNRFTLLWDKNKGHRILILSTALCMVDLEALLKVFCEILATYPRLIYPRLPHNAGAKSPC
jgi:hypothetical protein